uniref:Uncharacterized protein n=1 Tax=Ditylum brightwellii TaxID=49249 RepID=A0A7S4S8E5_9STRA
MRYSRRIQLVSRTKRSRNCVKLYNPAAGWQGPKSTSPRRRVKTKKATRAAQTPAPTPTPQHARTVSPPPTPVVPVPVSTSNNSISQGGIPTVDPEFHMSGSLLQSPSGQGLLEAVERKCDYGTIAVITKNPYGSEVRFWIFTGLRRVIGYVRISYHVWPVYLGCKLLLIRSFLIRLYLIRPVLSALFPMEKRSRLTK